MKRKVIATKAAPGAVGPYSQAVRAGRVVYTAGQIALDPASGDMVTSDEMTAATQTEQVLKNVQAVLAAAGCDLSHVVKTTVFLRYMKDFAEMNEVYERFFGDDPPARSTVAVAALPRGARVEIETVAIRPKKKKGQKKK